MRRNNGNPLLVRRRRGNDDDRILPLINVVFLLLIFFMVAGRLSASDPFRVTPPTSTSERTARAQELAVLIGADGRFALDGKTVDEAALLAAVRERIRRTPDIPLQLKADERLEAVKVVAFLEKLREAGVGKLQLFTMPATP